MHMLLQGCKCFVTRERVWNDMYTRVNKHNPQHKLAKVSYHHDAVAGGGSS